MNSAKHIDVISKYFYPVTAGIETNILETYSELVRLGWSVTVHTSAGTLDADNSLGKSDIIRGIKIIRYRTGILGYFPVINFSSESLIALHNFNVMPHLYIYLSVFFRKIMGRTAPNIFLTPHGGFTPEWPTFSPIVRFVKQQYHRHIGLWLANTQTAWIRAISPWEKQELIRAGVDKHKIVLIKNGLDKRAVLNHEKFASQSIKKKTTALGSYFVAVGRIAPIKNYETMIKAMALLPKDTKLVIIGPTQDISYLENLKKIARKLGVVNQIKFMGTLHGSDKYYVILHALCQIHLARWESFCNVVYEAKSLGQICVVADNTALTSLIEHNVNGFVTETFNPTKLAGILINIRNKSLAPQLRKMRATLKRESFPLWDVSAKKMHGYYKMLVQ